MSKKNLLKLALILVLSTAAAATSYAGTHFTGSTLLGGNSFSSSNNVDIYVATDGNTTDNQGFAGSTYTAKAKHEKGDKTIGCQATDPKLYFYLGTSTADTSNLSASTGDVFTSTSIWTSM